ncbi:MAG TPA: zinc-binding dehydrogenase, partial [Candidatus Angelobacter sp.]|nr:zinc-binding dehydrogenase [Candidatus Angelobacter sp.]
KTFGARVIAMDIADDKLTLARDLGADQTINASREDVAKIFRSMGGVHAVVVTSSSKTAYAQAFYAVRPAGALMVVGLPTDDIAFPAIMMREIKIRSVATGTRDDQRAVLDLAGSGAIRCLVETCDLTSINETLDKMRRGEISGRIAVKM